MTHTREVRAVEIGEGGFTARVCAILKEQGHVWLELGMHTLKRP